MTSLIMHYCAHAHDHIMGTPLGCSSAVFVAIVVDTKVLMKPGWETMFSFGVVLNAMEKWIWSKSSAHA